MRTILPGSTVGVLGGGHSARLFALAAWRMGYRVHAFSPAGPWGDIAIEAAWDDTARLREFASATDVVIVGSADAPLAALQTIADCSNLQPGAAVVEAAGKGIVAERNPGNAVAADFLIAGARGASGSMIFYEPIAFDRVDDAVDISRAPAAISLKPARRAAEILRRKMEELDVVGVACGVFTLTTDSELPLHEFTLGPHRAADLTLVANVTSQYEQHLRAVCGLPFGSTDLLRPAAMAVLADGIWNEGEPNWTAASAMPEVKLHLSGNRSGFLTATAASGTLAKQMVRTARASLTSK